MKYLLTGSSGFLGRYICEALSGHEVITIGRSKESVWQCDLRDPINALPAVDVVVHSAGKAHVVPKTSAEEREFYKVNLEGTRHLLHGVDQADRLPRQLVFISSVSVYGLECGEMISEAHPLLGESPYAASKIQAESLVQEWGKERGVAVLILRLPLLVGSRPPGNLGKMVNGIATGRYASIAGGKARKSMVLAEDVARLIADVGEQGGTYNLTDGYHPSFNELESAIARQLDTRVKIKLPMALAKTIAKIGDVLPFFPINTHLIDKMSLDLTFDDSKAARELHWTPKRVLEHRFLS